jgi:voltage-gated potassium channel
MRALLWKYQLDKKIYLGLLFLLEITLTGTMGYMVLEGYTFLEALYMTVITLGSVGYEEVKPLSDTGRIFTIVLILGNISALTYFLTTVSRYLLDGDFLKEYKHLSMNQAIEKLSNHVILCGYGRNGQEAGLLLSQNGLPFVVIEKNLIPADQKLPLPYFLHMDATQDEALQKAGVFRAKALITTLPDDASNVFVVLTAREMNPDLHIISRASQDSSVKKLKIAGATNVIMPDKLGGAQMATLVTNPDVKEFIDLMTFNSGSAFQVIEIKSGKELSLQELDCWNTTGATLLGIRTLEGDYLVNPSRAHCLQPGERLIAMGTAPQLDCLRERLR